jgi:F0F1-type ATP synthase assembly protein I
MSAWRNVKTLGTQVLGSLLYSYHAGSNPAALIILTLVGLMAETVRPQWATIGRDAKLIVAIHGIDKRKSKTKPYHAGSIPA